MTYIPNVRKRKITHHVMPCGGTKEEKNGYWQGYLDDAGVAWLHGFDYAVNEISNALYSLEDSGDGDFRDIGEIIGKYAECVVDDIPDEEWRTLSEQEKTVLLVRDHIAKWLECERDEIVVATIDGMDEDEYNRIVEDVDNGKRKTAYTEVVEE